MSSFLKLEDDSLFITLFSLESASDFHFLLEDATIMVDQVEITIPKTTVLEETTFPATAYFRTRSTKAESIPTTIHYRVDDLKTRKVLKDWTSVSPAASVEISMTRVFNEIQNNRSAFERKRLTVQADQGLSTQTNGSITWLVENLVGIT